MTAHARDAYAHDALPGTAKRPGGARGEGLEDSVDQDPSWGARWKTSSLSSPIWDRVLLDPIREILRRPGKSFRANLARATFALVDSRRPAPSELAVALEILHAGSLVIDDLADQSLERRGAPCLHRIYGLPRALNAGNYMYFWALERLAELELPPAAAVALQRRTNRTMLDCHRGQALDVGLWVGGIAASELGAAAEEISTLKTGALMSLAAYAGALTAGGSPRQLEAASSFGMRLGVVLQKLDDLGNLTSKRSPAKRFEDLRWGRVTWPWAWAAERLAPRSFAELEARSARMRRAHLGRPSSANRAAAASGQGLDAAPESAGVDGVADSELASIAAELLMCAGLHRRGEIRAELARTLGDLAAEFGEGPAVREMATEMERLEASYE